MDVSQQTPNTFQRIAQEQPEEDMISLRDILDTFLYNWKWFVLSVIICLAGARLYLATKPNVYSRQAVMLVKDDNSTGGRRSAVGTDALLQLNGVLGGTSVKNEVYILSSYQLVQEVVKNLNLDVLYNCKVGLKNISLYQNRPVTVTFHDEFQWPIAFKLHINNSSECTLSEVRYGKEFEESEFTKTVPFGQNISTPFGNISIAPLAENLESFKGMDITVTRISLDDATVMTCGKVSSSEMDKNSTLVRIVCTDTDIRRADDILAGLLEAYKQSIISDKNQLAQSTADFIDERIAHISNELSQVEGQLADFKQTTGLIDIKSNADAFLNQSTAARQRAVQAEIQHEMVKFLADYIRQNSSGNNLIPTLGGISDSGIQGQISQFNQLMLERNRLAANSGEASSVVMEMDSNLSQMRAALLASIQGYLSSLEVQLQRSRQEERELKGSLTAVPQKERQGLDITRQQVIKETLYTYLLNKREETALQLAITEANIRIVERPFGSKHPIAPRKAFIMLIALMLGVVLPYAYFYVKLLLNVSVRGKKDIEQSTTIPVLGEVPHRKDGFDESAIMVSEQSNDNLAEAFRMLRFNIGFINKDARVVMFTSTMPGEGKTFISRNFAATLALTGKKVVLLDTDIRKRTQSKLTARGRGTMGLTSYLSGDVNDVRSLITHIDNTAGLDFLPAGITPPNPAELLMSPRLESCIEELKKIYDYVVIDNVPAQVVADAGIVNRVAELTVYVIRVGKLDRRYLPELEQMYQTKKFHNLCIVINDSRSDKKNYGYGYGYSYGYGYGYGYGNADKKKKRSFMPWKW